MNNTKPVRPIPDGTPEERAAYQAMVARVVARATPKPPEFWARIAAMLRAGRRSEAA